MTSYENVLGLDIAQDMPAEPSYQGAPLCSAFGCQKNGLKTIAKPKEKAPGTRVLMFAQPQCSRKPDTDAGTIYYLPTGKFYKTVQNRIVPLPLDGSRKVIQVGISDVWGQTPDYQPDIYTVWVDEQGKDHVHFTSGYCDESHDTVMISDIKSSRYLGPPGLEGSYYLADSTGLVGGNLQQSHLGVNVPLNDAFSAMMVDGPIHRSSGTAYDSGSMNRPGKPCFPLAAQVPDMFKGYCVPEANWCCDYGVHDIPFPAMPLSGNNWAAVATPPDCHRAPLGTTTNTPPAGRPFSFWGATIPPSN